MPCLRTRCVRMGSCSDFCWCDWRAAQVTGPPLQAQGCFASLRDGLRPALTLEPLLPLSGNDEGRPGACPRHTRSAPIATRELSRDNVTQHVWTAEVIADSLRAAIQQPFDRAVGHGSAKPSVFRVEVDEQVRAGVANPVALKDLEALQGVIDVALDDLAVHKQRPRPTLRPGRVLDRIVHSDMEMRISVSASQLL
jgi:hypothetical protein